MAKVQDALQLQHASTWKHGKDDMEGIGGKWGRLLRFTVTEGDRTGNMEGAHGMTWRLGQSSRQQGGALHHAEVDEVS